MVHRVTFDGARFFDAEHAQAGAWNGWAAVAFTREQADAVAAYCAEMAAVFPDVQVPTWDGSAFLMLDPTYPEESQHISADANGLYWIGAYEWTWTIDN